VCCSFTAKVRPKNPISTAIADAMNTCIMFESCLNVFFKKRQFPQEKNICAKPSVIFCVYECEREKQKKKKKEYSECKRERERDRERDRERQRERANEKDLKCERWREREAKKERVDCT